MVRRARSPVVALALATASVVGCSAAPHAARRTPPTAPAGPAYVTPSRFVPDALPPTTQSLGLLPDGTRRLIVSGLRLAEHPDGTVEQAQDRLPPGFYRVVALPARLGGGVLFVSSAGGVTLLYRADEWLGALEPFARVNEATKDLLPGFDRLYLRSQRAESWLALDAKSGREMPLGPLPTGPRIGALAFADAWRAVAVVDLRGPMATFDAGGSWRPVDVDDETIANVFAEAGDLLLDGPTGRYRLGPSGLLAKESLRVANDEASKSPAADARGTVRSPLGRHPLRAAIEDGWPDSEGTAIVARAGALHRIRVEDGAVVATREHAYRGGGRCHAIALGAGFGFVCDADGTTSILAFDPPFGLRGVARFDGARFVTAGGTGGVAVRGGCGTEANAASAAAWCILPRDGGEREIRIAGDSGIERVVVLADGRVVVVVPPRDGEGGRLAIVHGASTTSVPIALGPGALEVARGLWLDGIEEREPGVLGAWVDVGGTLTGVRLSLDGKAEVAHASADVATTIVSGRFALDMGGAGDRPRESLDGGMSWHDVELPNDRTQTDSGVRACGPVGCLFGGWLRVGWGEPRGDEVAQPKTSRAPVGFARGFSLRCEATGESVGPTAPPKPARPPPGPPPSIGILGALGGVAGGIGIWPGQPGFLGRSSPRPRWIPFRGLAAPPLGTGDVGFDAGTDPGNPLVVVPTRLYAWGPKGADWSRAGRWLARFDDRFDLGGTRTTLATPSPFADDDVAADALGFGAGAFVNWNAKLDPSGTAAILFGCRAGRCDAYAAADGEPIVPIRDFDMTQQLDVHVSAVRVGQTWYVAAAPPNQSPMQALAIWRIEGGAAKRIARLPRATPSHDDPPRLVRRARGDGLGVLVLGPPAFGRNVRTWYVVPVDPRTGATDDPIRLVGSDLDSQAPARCDADDDGWLVDAQLAIAPALHVIAPPGAAAPSLAPVDLRLHLEAGRACIASIAARTEGVGADVVRAHGGALDPRTSIPATATDPTTGRRFGFRCAP